MKVRGLITAMVTPMHEGKVDELATKKLVNHLIEKGIHGLFILGTNGEFFSLTDNEKVNFVQIVVDEVAGRVPVFAGAGGIATSQVIDLSNKFANLGVDAVSVITPYLIKLSQSELIEHYTVIANKIKVPMILYNIPQNTGINIDVTIFEQLIKHPNIIGIKDSSGDIKQLENFIKINDRNDFSVLVGSDSKMLQAFELGADGAVSATSNFLTNTDLDIYKSFKEGDRNKARKLQDSIEPFRKILKYASIPSVLKYSMSFKGIDVGKPRNPIQDVEPQHFQEINKILMSYLRKEEI